MNEKQTYPIRCAWCKKIVGYTTIAGSDGICPDCAATLCRVADLQREARLQAELEELRRQYGVTR